MVLLRSILLAVLCAGWSLPALAIVVTLNDPGLSDPFVPTQADPPPPGAPDLVASRFDFAAAYQNAYGMASPNSLPERVGFAESQTMFVLVFANRGNAEVSAAQTIGFTVTGDYWTVKAELEFNPATAIIFDPNDELTLRGFAIHTGLLSAPDIPHPGDAASGPELSYEVTVNAGNKTPRPPFGLPGVGDADGTAGEHPSVGHPDIIGAVLFASVFSGTTGGIDFFDEISGWAAFVAGVHVPEPDAALLLGFGAVALLVYRRRRSDRSAAPARRG